MSTTAPAIGGASGSGPTLHSAWNPYAVLPPTTRRKIDPSNKAAAHSFLTSLDIPAAVAQDRLASKYLQLETPTGKVSDRRKAQLKKQEEEKEKRKVNRVREGDCGLVGRRKRAALGKDFHGTVRYDSVLPVYELWLGYMAELLALPVQLPTPQDATSRSLAPPVNATSVLVPTFPPRPTDEDPSQGLDLKLNVPAIQAKLVKAEFVGCKLTVKRAKNPSLVNITGIVLQETLGTFKVVTPKSAVKVLSKKGSIFTFSLPLAVPTSPNHATTTSREVSFDIYGDAFAYRSSDRVGKKWKAGSGPGGVELK
ncbi:ribonuclease P protein subunit POP4, partial [Phenoliferia sp. Uapishka_3]